jgi:hypothetical protein
MRVLDTIRVILAARRDRTLQERFTRFYRTNAWSDPETRSGPGSRRDSGQVRDAIEALRGAVEAHGVRSIADIPCGDFNWMPIFLDAAPDVEYRGFDIVPQLIAENRARYPGRRFDALDVTREVPPRADLIFCKDLLNHLCHEDVAAALENMRRSGARLLLASNNFGHPNVDLPRLGPRGSRHLDIMGPPFAAPNPIWRTHYLGLWRLEDFPQPQGVVRPG